MAVKAGANVVAALNQILKGELTSVNQYFLHAKILSNRGYLRLASKIRRESIDEMKHADELIERILYLEGMPNVQDLGHIQVGETVPEMFTADLALERDAIPLLNESIALCVKEGDNGTRALLEAILVSEEEHLDWLETQMGLIAELGAGAYLAEQMAE